MRDSTLHNLGQWIRWLGPLYCGLLFILADAISTSGPPVDLLLGLVYAPAGLVPPPISVCYAPLIWILVFWVIPALEGRWRSLGVAWLATHLISSVWFVVIDRPAQFSRLAESALANFPVSAGLFLLVYVLGQGTLWWAVLRREPVECWRCPHCGYDRFKSPTERCSECGASTTSARR